MDKSQQCQYPDSSSPHMLLPPPVAFLTLHSLPSPGFGSSSSTASLSNLCVARYDLENFAQYGFYYLPCIISFHHHFRQGAPVAPCWWCSFHLYSLFLGTSGCLLLQCLWLLIEEFLWSLDYSIVRGCSQAKHEGIYFHCKSLQAKISETW